MIQQVEILVCTTHKILDEKIRDESEAVWKLSGQPKHPVKNIYFATEGVVRGSFKIKSVRGGEVMFETSSWQNIRPVAQPHFQGFKYITSNVNGDAQSRQAILDALPSVPP